MRAGRGWSAVRVSIALKIFVIIDWWTANPPAADWTGAWHLAEK